MKIHHLSVVLALVLTGKSLAQVLMSTVTCTPTPTPAPQSQDYHPARPSTPGHVKLAFMGDINLGRHMTDLFKKNGAPWALQACKPFLDEADLAVANLESPVGDGGEEYTEKSVYLKGRPQDLDVLSYGGIGLVTLANNHVLDYGPEVANQTVEGLDRRGILHTGLVASNGRPQEPVYVTVQGVTLAFLGYCSVCPGKFEAGKDKPGVEVALSAVMLPEIKKAKAKADFVIVLVHWGTEYYGVNALQEKLAQSLHKGGADLVIGSHPHVLQKIQRIEKTLVAYSLGDFLFDLTHAACQDSCILTVDLQKGKEPQWTAVPLDLSSGRPEPLADQADQAQLIQQILKKGYEYNGQKDKKILNSEF
ncbi:MAG TPA: CapA family protein [bacterium]|nr:CapA family protein [bacterium]